MRFNILGCNESFNRHCFNLCFVDCLYSPQRRLPGEESGNTLPPFELANSSGARACLSPTRDEVGEATSHLNPSVRNTERGADEPMAEVQTLGFGDQGEVDPLVTQYAGLNCPESSAPTALMPPSHAMVANTSPAREGAEDTQPPILVRHQEIEDALKSTLILPEHRAVLSTAYNQFRSVEARMMEAFISLSKGFEVCYLLVILHNRTSPS